MKTNQQKTSQQRNSRTDKAGAEKIMRNAQQIVSSAVNVLEEEIAAGIIAAKRLENKFINIEEVRTNQDQLMNRIRRDTHEAVDLFLDAFAALMQQVNKVVDTDKEKDSKNTPTATKKSHADSVQTIFLEYEKSVKPGETALFQIVVSDDEKAAQFALIKSDFTANNGTKISHRYIAISPSSLNLQPKEKAEINIQVKIPVSALPGFYRAVLSDQFNSRIIVVLSLQIE